MGKLVDFTGQRFGRLVVLHQTVRLSQERNAMWLCQCDCGRQTRAAGANLGKTKTSCGCLASENGTKMLRTNRLMRKDLHGMSQTSEHGIWSNMKRRCEDPKSPKYPRYGGRGIRVCECWRESFVAFVGDMGLRPSPRHSIDRIDNDGNYEPGNCRWASAKQQVLNSSIVRMITIDDKTLCIKDWEMFLGVPKGKIAAMCRAINSNGTIHRSRSDSPEAAILKLYREKFEHLTDRP